MLPHFVVDSAAWHSLTSQQINIVLVLLRRYDGRNNGRLALSARDAASQCRINKDTAVAAFRVLIARGFIERTAEGSFAYKKLHSAEWRLTWLKCDRTGEVPTMAFQRWRPDKNNSVRIEGHPGPKPGTVAGLIKEIAAKRSLDIGPDGPD